MIIEIVFYGRGGQGGVTSSELLASAAVYDGYQAQSFPYYGAERRGAPVMAFSRISDKKILKHGMFYSVDYLVILDKAVLPQASRFTIKKGGKVVVNTGIPIKDNIERSFRHEGEFEIYAVDATKISIEEGLVLAGWPLVNTSILGALAKVMGIIRLESILKAIDEKFNPKIADKNKKAVLRAYDSVLKVSSYVYA